MVPNRTFLLSYNHRVIHDTASSTHAKLCPVINGNDWSWPDATSNELVEIQSLLFNIHPCHEKMMLHHGYPSKSGDYHYGATWKWFQSHGIPVPWYVLA